MALFLSFFSCETYKSLTKKRKKSVERGLLTTVVFRGEKNIEMSIYNRMRYYKVPAVGIAVIDRYKVEWTEGYGVKNIETSNTVTENSLFQAGDLSQAVTALGVIRSLEKNKISLDQDVNDILKSWRLPYSGNFGGEKVTPRQLLSHSAGLNKIQYKGYLQGQNLPSLLQILNGEKPAHSPPVRVENSPGSGLSYSEGGYMIIQRMLVDLENKPFSKLMEELVFSPLGMENSTFKQPLPEKYKQRAVIGYLQTGQPVGGKWYNYPEMAATGLWTIPGDLALFTAALMKAAMGKNTGVITTQGVRTMLTPHMGKKGLGVNVEGEGDNLNFNLEGGTKGYSCYLVAYPARGQGAVIMTNSENGTYLIQEILRAISSVYEWPHFEPQTKTLYRLQPQIYQQYVGRYQLTPNYTLNIAYEDYYLVVQAPGQGRTKFYVDTRTSFFSRSPYTEIRFIRNAQGEVTKLLWKRDDEWREAQKIE